MERVTVTLRIDSGSEAKRQLAISAGKTLRVGRTTAAECAVPEDSYLSRFHFELRYDGCSCLLRDLKSSNGTRVNGQPVSESMLQDGDRIRAGRTDFVVCIENAAVAEAVSEVTYERLLASMRGSQQPLHAVVDSSLDPAILQLLLRSKAEYHWLFRADGTARLAHFVPYLVPLPSDSPLLELLVTTGWGKNWGIFLTSTAAPEELLAFVRGLLATHLPDGRAALLRFYDPRVLGALLMSSTCVQQRQLFGPVSSYLVEAGPETAVGFTMGPCGLEKTELSLLGTAPAKTMLVESVSTPASHAARPAYGATMTFTPCAEQVDLLKGSDRDAFREEMLDEIRKLFPAEFEGAGGERIKNFVEYGCTRPKCYGICSRADLRRYIHLMVQLGRDFDVDPGLPWAARLLARRMPAAEKLDRLKAAKTQHCWSKELAS